MKVQLAVIILLLLFTSCRKNEKICHLTGSLDNAADTTIIFLADWENKILFDSIQIIDGVIDYKFEIERPKHFLLHNKRRRYPFRDQKFIWLEPSKINITGNFEFLHNLKLEGSASQNEFENYNLLVDDATSRINEIKEQIPFKTEVEKKKDTIKIENLQETLSDSIVEFMLNHSNSYVTLTLLHNECYFAFRHLDKKQISGIYNQLPANLKELNQGLEIKKYLELPGPPKIGDIAPEINQITPDGDTVKLSDYRGKYVLVDFWDSYCGPCRASHKWLRAIYEKYNAKGFEILSVSSDTDRNRWVNAIKSDSISWTNISDLNGFKNEAFLRYDVKFIPQNYLVNPDGKIIKYRLCSEFYADDELGKIFKNKNGL